MTGSLWVWMVLAIILFWVVGVYNRLMRMRSRGVAALRSVAKHMRQYATLVDQQVQRAPHMSLPGAEHMLTTASPEWSQLLATLHALDLALQDAKGMPLATQSVARVGEAFEATQHLWQHWYDTPTGLAESYVPDAMRLQWDAATHKVRTARLGLNHILATYNEAIAQYPARLVVRWMGFRPAGLM